MTQNRGSLTFMGLGLGGLDDISLKAKSHIQEADLIFAECYTSIFNSPSLEDLEKSLSANITILDRPEVEDGTEIVESAVDGKVVFITAGDSMSATTHVELRLTAKRKGIPVKIVHSPSVLTAVPSELGLSHYKFGRTTTLVFPQKNYFPLSPYDTISSNLSMGLHTLVLLDIMRTESTGRIDPDLLGDPIEFGNRSMSCMSSHIGCRVLSMMEEKRKESILKDETLVCSVARAGAMDSMVRSHRISVMREVDMGRPLHSLVIPGKLHFMEAKALVELTGAPAEILDDYE